MSVVAVCNMKGGVGKTTAAVNLAYLAAASGQRVLLWDLDPQAASSFAFRVQPRVAGFGKRRLESGQTLAAAVRATDYDRLDLLPADFAYRKFDRLLAGFERPERVVTTILDSFNGEYDTVFLDCPAGFSLLTEGVFAAADAVLVPTIPAVLSLRTVARGIKWAGRSGSPSELAAFFSMVDRRKPLHRRACEWAAGHPELFLAGQIPYAAIVEQMAVRRMPLAAFAPRDAATAAFETIWVELQARLERRATEDQQARHGRWQRLQRAIESLIVHLEPAGGRGPADDAGTTAAQADAPGGEVEFVHSFDTDGGDLQRCGYVLELRERAGMLLVVAARFDSGAADGPDGSGWAHAEIDGVRALKILSGAMSPLEAFGSEPDRQAPWVLAKIRAAVGERTLKRAESHVAQRADAEDDEPSHTSESTARPAPLAGTWART